MKKRNKIFLLLILALSVVLAILFLNNKSKSETPEYTSDSILEKISFIQELSLVKYNYSGVISYNKNNREIMTFEVPYSKKSFLIKYNGYVKAGINMQETKVEVEGNIVRVHLPKPIVLETVIDEKSMLVYDEKMEIFAEKKMLKDYQKAIVGEKNRITRNAVEKGILTESSDQAHKFIRNFLSELGFETIIIDEQGVSLMPERVINR